MFAHSAKSFPFRFNLLLDNTAKNRRKGSIFVENPANGMTIGFFLKFFIADLSYFLLEGLQIAGFLNKNMGLLIE